MSHRIRRILAPLSAVLVFGFTLGAPASAAEPDSPELAACKATTVKLTDAVHTLFSENTDQFFELQDLRARVAYAEGNLSFERERVSDLQRKVAHLRAKLRAK